MTLLVNPFSESSYGRLAIAGGQPTRRRGWKDNFTTDIREVVSASRPILSGYLSLFEGSHTPDSPFSFLGGPEVQALEHEWAALYGSDHAVSVNSATSGLFAAVGALGLGFGDEVIVSPYTMSACALAPIIYGAIPIFADVDLDSGCLDPRSIESLISPRTKAIIVVHQFGIPADMTEIMRLAKKHRLKVIEDCAQAHGARHRGQLVGTFGDVGVFSLNVNKAIQSGEGGVCITNDEEVTYRLRLIRNHGEAVVGPAGYSQITNVLGFNYRMTEVTAAIARSQLKKLPKLNAHRLSLIDYLANEISALPWLRLLKLAKGSCDCGSDESCCSPTYYLAPLRLELQVFPIERKFFIEAMNAEGIPFNAGYVKPLYFQPLYQRREAFKSGYPFTAPENSEARTNYQAGACPVAEEMHFKSLVLSEHVRWPHKVRDVKDMVTSLKKFDTWVKDRGEDTYSSREK